MQRRETRIRLAKSTTSNLDLPAGLQFLDINSLTVALYDITQKGL